MPGAQANWQLRWCRTPLTVKRHSMQIPIPQRGARGSPVTENRQGSPAIITAAATLVPSATRTALPFTRMEIQFSFNGFSASAPAATGCRA
jgi:hypothetical protein